jgi:primosomal protein N' (replication factor Y)
MRYLELVFNRPLGGSFTYLVGEELLAKAGDPADLSGRRVRASLGRQELTAFVRSDRSEPPTDLPAGVAIKEIRRIIDDEAVAPPQLFSLADWMARAYFCAPGEALSAMIPSGKRDVELPSLPGDEDGFAGRPAELSDEQRSAVDAICREAGGRYYLYGITGSGKTEVFLRAAEKTLSEGRGIIYLVPEISLTHQVVKLIRARFDQQAAVLHSSLSPSQRIAEWRRILRGEARFVIGARSAIFAPMENIGLIIIDEEHESSYKSGSTPRYHARQIAMHRAAGSGARLVMGSATPSVEAWHVMNQGSLKRLNLTRRLSGGAMPSMEIVNIRGSEGSLSPRLTKAVRETLAQGRQVILFLNRRGFGYFYHCRSCGRDFSCTRCSVSLTYHKAKGRLVCHHCGYQIAAPSSCPDCGSLDLGFSGFGTERVEEDVHASFPNARVLRLDTDSTRKKGVLESGIESFRNGEIDILLGTQMVAKGLNFPGVKLVGIIMADSSLHLPDFRSYEKTFALITQVAGRAGRYHPDGQVILQTLNPAHHVIRMATDHAMDEFYRRELESRRELNFPPFSRILRLLIRGKDASRVWDSASRMANAVRARFTAGELEMLGPAESPLAVVNRNYRVHMLLLTPRIAALQASLPELLADLKLPGGVYLEIDTDPQSLL